MKKVTHAYSNLIEKPERRANFRGFGLNARVIFK
jgi:hypothetical protein